MSDFPFLSAWKTSPVINPVGLPNFPVYKHYQHSLCNHADACLNADIGTLFEIPPLLLKLRLARAKFDRQRPMPELLGLV